MCVFRVDFIEITRTIFGKYRCFDYLLSSLCGIDCNFSNGVLSVNPVNLSLNVFEKVKF